MADANDLRAAARAAVRPVLRLGRVTKKYSANEYDVQVPGHVDAYGIEVPMVRIRSVASTEAEVGDQVYVAQANPNRPSEGALFFVIAREQQVEPTVPKIVSPWWPRGRQTQQRKSLGTIDFVTLTGISPLTISSAPTTLVRIDGQHLYQVCLVEISSVWKEVVQAWPLDNPADPYVAAWQKVLASTSTPQAKHALLPTLIPGLAVHDGTSSYLRSVQASGITNSDAAVASVFEPVETSNRRLLVVTVADVDEWSWSKIEPVGLAVSSAFTTGWDDWSAADTLPNSEPPDSYPIFMWSDTFSALDIKDLPLVSVVTDEAQKYIALPTDDPAWLTAAADDRSSMLAHENDADRNIAHIFSRGQLYVITETGATAWKKDFRTSAAAADLEGLYGGVSPLLSLTVSGRPVLFSHYVRNVFEAKTIKTIIYRSDIKSDIDDLGTTDPHAFNNLSWSTSEPAPPWSWRDDYIDSRITYYLGQWTTTFNTLTRDVQTASHHGFCAHDMRDGTFVARRAFKYDAGETLGRRGTRLYATKDTGDPTCDVHDEAVTPHAPNLLLTGAVTQKTGSTSSSTHTLRNVLGLTDDERVVLYIAKEQYTGITWTCWSKEFIYYYGTAPAWDSRTTKWPAYDYSTTPPTVEEFDPPYWEQETNEFGLISAYPYGNYSNSQPYQILGNATVGYETTTSSTFYTAHARYCLQYSDGEVEFLEPTIGFTNFTDPLGNFDHHTVSIEYHALVVTKQKIACDVADITYGWNPFNTVSDGEFIYCLPRAINATTIDEENPPPITPPQPATMACEVLMMAADLSSKTVVTLDSIHTLTVHPVGLAVSETAGGRPQHSHLYVWCAGTNASSVRVGKLYHLVDGAVAESIVISGSDTWDGAQLSAAKSVFDVTSDDDSALYLSGHGTGGKLIRIGLHNGYFNP